jgi:hypothetical protein
MAAFARLLAGVILFFIALVVLVTWWNSPRSLVPVSILHILRLPNNCLPDKRDFGDRGKGWSLAGYVENLFDENY